MLEKSYDPAAMEARLYASWESQGLLKSGPGEEEGFGLLLPPPNVTGSLHMGHAFQQTLMDILVRFQRMEGRAVRWQIGVDHAGIATQMLVERKLLAEQQCAKETLGRDRFIDEVWKWKAHSGMSSYSKCGGWGYWQTGAKVGSPWMPSLTKRSRRFLLSSTGRGSFIEPSGL